MSEIISNLAAELKAAVTGTKTPPRNPTEFAANVIAETALPTIKKLPGFQAWLDDEKKIRAVMHDRNHGLSDLHADRLFQKQMDEHAAHAESGKPMAEISRGRSREAWQADIEARRRAADAAIVKMRLKLEPTRKKIGQILVQTLNEEAADFMLAEAKLGSRFGFIYAESPALNKLKSLQPFLTDNGHVVVFQLLTK